MIAPSRFLTHIRTMDSVRFLAVVLFLATVAPPANAWERHARTTDWQLDGSPTALQTLELRVAPQPMPPTTQVSSSDARRESLLALAGKLSTLGAFLLTADQVVRSVDSVMDRLTMERDDGTVLKFRMEPALHGFSVQLAVSRPLDF